MGAVGGACAHELVLNEFVAEGRWRRQPNSRPCSDTTRQVKQMRTRGKSRVLRSQVCNLWLPSCDVLCQRPKDVTLWLGCEERGKRTRMGRSTPLLEAAFEANPKSDAILLAAAKIESEDGQYARARVLLGERETRLPRVVVFG